MRRLAADTGRHLLLVTATPHSGKEEGFRNLIGLLDPELANLDLGAAKGRERLARHMVQRRRSHIRKFLEQETAFPSDRLIQEQRYYLTGDYRKLFDLVLSYARETVRDSSGGPLRQRVRYWSALALLRALASSPRAAAATLRTRARTVLAQTVEEADTVGRATVLDLAEAEAAEAFDVVPGADDGPRTPARSDAGCWSWPGELTHSRASQTPSCCWTAWCRGCWPRETTRWSSVGSSTPRSTSLSTCESRWAKAPPWNA